MIDLVNGRLGRYELRERIGTGGMARVYKAWDTTLERLVAIKILHEHLADDPTFKVRFEREAKFIAGFNHPNIVQVYDFDIVYRDGIPLCYMVMSYIPGPTLHDVLAAAEQRGERLTSERVRALVDDLAGALGYAHQRGMVHRDVKPGNVLLTEAGRAILTDFGIARLVQSNRLTADGVSTGTPIYMSPEQANGEPGDARSDLYALGVIVYELLTGRPPFADDTSLAVMLKHLNTPPAPPSERLSTRQYDAFVARALAKNPDERFQSAAEFAAAFRQAAAAPDSEKTTILPSMRPIPVVTAPKTTSILRTITQQARQHPRTSSALTIAALGAIALFILLLNATAARLPATATPALAASAPGASNTVYFSSSFNTNDPYNAFWPTENTDFLTRVFTPDGLYQLHNAHSFTAETSIYHSATPYDSVSIEMIGKLEPTSQPNSAYGIVFRYQDEDNYNVFAVDGQGRYSVWLRRDGAWRELRAAAEKWTSSDAILRLGGNNDLSISVFGSFVTGYVNGRQLVRVDAGTLPAGRIGLYFATDDGAATVSVDSYRVFSSVPSMTTGA